MSRLPGSRKQVSARLQQLRSKKPSVSVRRLAYARFFLFFRHLNLKTLRKTAIKVGRQRLPGLASEMAYNAMLSLFPAILAVLTAVGLFGGSTQDTFQRLVSRWSEVAPEEVSALVGGFGNFVETQLYTSSNGSLFWLSFVAAIWTASSVLTSAMLALDRIYQIPRRKLRPFWKTKLVAIGLTLGTIVLLILASFLVFVSDLIIRWVAQQSGMFKSGLLTLWQLLAWPLALGIVAIAAAFIYRYGPSRWRSGTPIVPGAMLAALLWAGVSGGFRLYVSHFGNYNRAYGAIGAVIILMLWLYLSSLALLLGAQLNTTVGEDMRSRWSIKASVAEASTESTKEDSGF